MNINLDVRRTTTYGLLRRSNDLLAMTNLRVFQHSLYCAVYILN